MKINADHLYPLSGACTCQDDISRTWRHHTSILLLFPQSTGKTTVLNFLNGIHFNNVLSPR